MTMPIDSIFDTAPYKNNKTEAEALRGAPIATEANVLRALDTPKVDVKDMVNNPSHYNKGGVECIEAIKASMSVDAFHGYLKGTTIKYMWRYESKTNSIQDLKKAQWFLNRLIGELNDIS